MTEEESNQKSLERSIPKLQEEESIHKKQEQANDKPEQGEQKNNNDGSTLYVTNLSSKITTEKLQDAFREFGHIEKCYVICNPITGESRNFGFVTFAMQSDAQKALESMNNKNVEGKVIKVEVARRNEPHEPTPGQYKGVRGVTKRNGKSTYRRGFGYPYERRRNEPRRYNPYYEDQIRGSSRNHFKSYGDRSYRHKHRGDFRDYERRSYASKSVERRSIDRRSINRRSIDRKSYGRRSIEKRSIERRSHGRKRVSKRSIDRYPSERSYDRYPRRGGDNHKKSSKYDSKLGGDDPLSHDKYDKKKIKYNRSRRSCSSSIGERRHHRTSISNHRSPYHRKR